MNLAYTRPLSPATGAVIPRDRLLRLPAVEEVTGCKKSTIYTLMKEGKFPKSISITRRMSAWPETAVLQWVQDRINQGAVSDVQTPAQSSTAAAGGVQS